VIRFAFQGPSGVAYANITLVSDAQRNCTVRLQAFRKNPVPGVVCCNGTNTTNICGRKLASLQLQTDFGAYRTNASKVVHRTYRLYNLGTTNLTTSVAQINGPFTTTSLPAPGTVIAPNNYINISVQHTFDTDGTQVGWLSIGSDATNSPCNFTLSATSLFLRIVQPTQGTVWVMYINQKIQWVHNLDTRYDVTMTILKSNSTGLIGPKLVTMAKTGVQSLFFYWPPHLVLARQWLMISSQTTSTTLTAYNNTVWGYSWQYFLKERANAPGP